MELIAWSPDKNVSFGWERQAFVIQRLRKTTTLAHNSPMYCVPHTGPYLQIIQSQCSKSSLFTFWNPWLPVLPSKLWCYLPSLWTSRANKLVAAFSTAASGLWNGLPIPIKNAETVWSFKKWFKTHLFSTCSWLAPLLLSFSHKRLASFGIQCYVNPVIIIIIIIIIIINYTILCCELKFLYLSKIHIYRRGNNLMYLQKL